MKIKKVFSLRKKKKIPKSCSVYLSYKTNENKSEYKMYWYGIELDTCPNLLCNTNAEATHKCEFPKNTYIYLCEFCEKNFSSEFTNINIYQKLVNKYLYFVFPESQFNREDYNFKLIDDNKVKVISKQSDMLTSILQGYTEDEILWKPKISKI